VRNLTRKLLRDVVTLRWQIATIAVVVAAGVAILVSSVGTYRSLLAARERFYVDADFPHVFSRVSRAPDDVTTELSRIDGVAGVETRLTFEVPVDVEGVQEPVTARVISLSPPDRAPVARLLLDWGRLPEPRARNEGVVSEAFAKARRLSPGDRIHVVLNGHREEVTIVGAVLSAEHLAVFPSGGFMPDDAHFGILWLSHDAVGSAFQAKGTFNEVALRLSPGASEERVIASVDRVLAPYGSYGAYGRSEQPAYLFIESELAELEVEASFLPVIFLGVAAFLLNGVLARIVANERTQIATLRAIGFRVGPIVRHYLALAAITASVGVIAGLGLGVGIGKLLTASYRDFFRFPSLAFGVEPWIVALAFVTSVGAGLAGAFASVRRVARLAPAEAMQPAAPPTFRTAWLERVPLVRHLDPSKRLVLRNILARPGRTMTAVLGVAAAMAVLVVGAFWNESLGFLVAHEFQLVRREDATVTFTHATEERALRELAHVPGIRAVEGIRSVPARISLRTSTKRVELLGLPEGARLHQLLAADGTEVTLPREGIVISRNLARRLGASRGERLTVDFLEGKRAQREVTLALVVDEFLGVGAYMDAGALGRLLGEGSGASGALVTIEPGSGAGIHEALKKVPGVATVIMKSWSLRLFSELLMAIIVFASLILTLFGAAIVVGVVYNAARILVAERARELATFRVIGFTRGDVSETLLLELGIQVVLGIPLGAAIGYALCAMAVHLFGPEDMSIPLVVGPRTWALSLSVVIGSALVSALLVRRRLDRLDLVGVLKVRE
jgi:putative ABC transport system permease protein